MCKLNKKSGDTRIDPCIKQFIKNINLILPKEQITLASCCGHGKYTLTIIIGLGKNLRWDLVSGKVINRKKKFYKKDKQGYYYIPEVINGTT